MTSKGVRRKKSSLTEIKVAVIGAPSVGKSALTVRFLTKRYIGEYDHQADSKYKHEILVDGVPVLFEILDSCPKGINDMPGGDVAQWADCIVMVYSITDRESFEFIQRTKALCCDMPAALVGNKADMVHLRQVGLDEGETLAGNIGCRFYEVATAEQVSQVADVFLDLAREVFTQRRRSQKYCSSLLDRVLGTKANRVYNRGKSDSALRVPKE